MGTSISMETGGTASTTLGQPAQKLRSRNPPRPNSAVSSCCIFSASLVLAQHRVSSTEVLTNAYGGCEKSFDSYAATCCKQRVSR